MDLFIILVGLFTCSIDNLSIIMLSKLFWSINKMCKAQTAMAANVDKRRRFVWGSTGADQEAVSYRLSAQMAIQSAVIS